MKWTVLIAATAEESLLSITDQRVRRLLQARAQKLEDNPDLQGKPLSGGLTGLRSVRAVGQRYRLIFQLLPELKQVVVLALGLRKEGDRGDVSRRYRRRK